MQRRRFVKNGLLGASAGLVPAVFTSRTQAAPAAKVHEIKTISQEPEYYCGWPTVARRSNGELLVSWSGGRESHVCPFGRVEMMRSHDDGATWTWPRVLLDGPIDDRDSGVLETATGSLLVTTFTSLAYEERYMKAGKPYSPNWEAANNRLTAEQRQAELGQWAIRSTDGGISWSARIPTLVNSPHGPCQLADGRLLYAGKELWTEEKRIGVAESTDDGQTWTWLAAIPAREGDTVTNYHELHAAELPSGRIVVHIRNHNQTNHRETLQTESEDGGKTWTVPHSIDVWGLPSFLTPLSDGRLLMSYGYRREPHGNQARISEDEGRSWSAPLTISSDGANGDLGYPSTVELAGQKFLTVWYEQRPDSPKAVLRQAVWSLES